MLLLVRDHLCDLRSESARANDVQFCWPEVPSPHQWVGKLKDPTAAEDSTEMLVVDSNKCPPSLLPRPCRLLDSASAVHMGSVCKNVASVAKLSVHYI